jgi:hypothetical protein
MVSSVQNQNTTTNSANLQQTEKQEQKESPPPPPHPPLPPITPSVDKSQETSKPPSPAASRTIDWHDAFVPSTWSNWALVVLGIAAIVGAFFTLRAMWTQAGIMRDQTIAARDNAASAKANAEAAGKNIEIFISKERARLTVEPKKLSLVPKVLSVYTVDFSVSIFGTTPAFVTESGCVTYFRPLALVGSTDVEPLMMPLLSLPKIISPNIAALDLSTNLYFRSDPVEAGGIVKEINEDRLFVEFKGFINYRDVFDNERETKFRFLWKYSSLMPIGPSRFGSWEKCGPPEENKET